MASVDSTTLSVSGRLRSGDLLHAGLAVILLLGVWSVGGLEVSTGKVSSVEAMNGSTVLLPCTYSSCIGIKDLHFNWHFDDNGTMDKLCEGDIPMEGVEPRVSVFHDRVEFVGSSKTNNISILLWNITFDDQGKYICFAKNPKEKNRNHSAVFTLRVVDQSMCHMHTPAHTWYTKKQTKKTNFILMNHIMRVYILSSVYFLSPSCQLFLPHKLFPSLHFFSEGD
ncbi:sodium channel subunit beta-4 [Solea senegalensis]|uniref:Sodium channel subunit beta-4 n=1 Tax=Solea senegalensis TaxID=28829 RepID=A0AAV6Q221_SOLSE|nr:sodium channel subunit beta-4 [Solea senegalensis]